MTQSSWNGRPVLVTGAAGFIGSHLVEALLARGASVLAVDCLESPWRLSGVAQNITYLNADITQWTRQNPPIEKVDVVFHLAAFAMPSAAEQQPESAFRHNVMGTVAILRLAREWKVSKFVFTSAGALYTNVPVYVPMDEQHPIDPGQSVYAQTKRIGELLCDDAHRTYGVPTLYVRLFNTYGPRQAPEYLIPSFIAQAWANGKVTVRNDTVKRDFTYVSDMVEALLKGAESAYCGGPVNLGTGVEHSIGAVAALIGALLGVEVESLNQPVFGPKRQLCDASLAKRVLRWEPVCPLEEGLRRTVQWFAEDPTLSIESGRASSR